MGPNLIKLLYIRAGPANGVPFIALTYITNVISAKEPISDDPVGILVESMLEGDAEYYSAELSLKVARGMTDNACH